MWTQSLIANGAIVNYNIAVQCAQILSHTFFESQPQFGLS